MSDHMTANAKSDSAIGIVAPKPAVHPQIAEYHRKLEDRAGLVKIGAKTYSAMGFGGNINFIVGTTGVILVNTGSFVEWSAEALAEFRKVSDKPIVGIIYTHGYSDHTGGVRAFIPVGAGGGVEVFANAIWEAYVSQATSPMQPEVILRAAAQLGWLLPKGEHAAIGSALSRYMQMNGSTSYLAPTRGIKERTVVTLAGVTLELIPAPHDLDDGMIVWMADERILFGGDTLLPGGMYPTIATPRFEARRDPQKWAQSMGLAASFNADYLINAYGDFIAGAETIKSKLVGQQKLSQYLIDETNRLVFSGATASEIADAVTIPPELAKGQNFNDLYHRLSWIVRSLISREFGWFSGDGLDYVRHPPRDKAERLAQELGGFEVLLERAAIAYRAGDLPWALELATEALTLDPKNDDARSIRLNSLRAIAFGASSSNERNFLLTQVALETGELDRQALLRAFRGKAPSDASLLRTPSRLLDLMGPKLKRDIVGTNPLSVRFELTDRPERLEIAIVDGVMLRGPDPDGRSPDLVLRLSYDAFIRGAEGMNSFFDLRASRALSVETGAQSFDRFVGSFDW